MQRDPDRHEDDDHRITDRLDRDLEREGGYGSYLPFRRATVTLIPNAAGVLQPMVPIPPTKNGGGR